MAGQRVEFLGFHFDCFNQSQVIEALEMTVRQEQFGYVVTPNVDHVVARHRDSGDAEVAHAYANANLTLCDSRVLQLLARWSGLQLPLVTGSDLTPALLRKLDEAGTARVAVIGGDAALLAALRQGYLGIAWVQHVPPMGVRRDPVARGAITQFVEEARADYILFAIGAPQSEIVCAMIAERNRARGVALCIGASLEFVTGIKRRAPRLLQRARLEWLFRLAAEPRRLWRRYLVEGPKIVGIWLRWRLNRSRPAALSASSRRGSA